MKASLRLFWAILEVRQCELNKWLNKGGYALDERTCCFGKL